MTRQQWGSKFIISSLIASAFVGGWWLAGQRKHREELVQLADQPKSQQHSISKDKIVVTAEPVVVRSLQRSIEAVGTLHGFEELTLSSKVEGRVLKIHHDLANIVRPGDILLELDSTDAKLAVEQAEKGVEAELAKWGFTKVPLENEDLSTLPIVVSARLRFELAQSRLQRMLPLQQTNSIAAEDLEQAKSDARIMESDWKNQLLMANSAAAVARLRQADLSVAHQRLRDCEIRVPTPTMVDNPVDQVYTVSERTVSEGSFLRLGTEVFKLVLGKTLKLRLSVPESFSAKVEVGQYVEVVTISSPQATIGKVTRISPAIDRSTRSFLVEAEVPNDNGVLKPGSFAKAKIQIGSLSQAITIPLAGLYSFAGINKMFVIEAGNAREIKVTIGEQTNDWVEISSPELPANAMVVTSGQRMLSDGLAIAIRGASQSTSQKDIPRENTTAMESQLEGEFKR